MKPQPGFGYPGEPGAIFELFQIMVLPVLIFNHAGSLLMVVRGGGNLFLRPGSGLSYPPQELPYLPELLCISILESYVSVQDFLRRGVFV